jgi:hypothetical protein
MSQPCPTACTVFTRSTARPAGWRPSSRPPALIEEHTYLVVPSEARAWALAAGLPLPPEEYDAIQPPVSSPHVNITSPAMYTYVRGKVMLQGTAAGEGFRFYQLQAGQGLNPSDWLQASPDGSQPVQNGVLGTWDTTGLDGLYALRLVVVRQDQSVETSIVQVTVDNRAPLARLVYPVAGQILEDAAGRNLTFQAEASDGVRVARVVWLVDGRMVGVDRFGRNIHYLRISLTDHCNLRCVYCMPEDMTFRPNADLMQDDELLLLVRLFATPGI